MELKKVRTKPITVEAVFYAGGPDRATPIVKWIKDNGGRAEWHPAGIVIGTSDREAWANRNTWIIKGVSGGFYVLSEKRFAEIYEVVDETEEK